MSSANTDEMKQEIKKYFVIFGILLSLSFLTVGISYLHLSIPMTVFFVLVIASIQVFFAAGYFMHLISERTILVYLVLVLTLTFAAAVLILPTIEHHDPIYGTIHAGVTPPGTMHSKETRAEEAH